MSFEFISKFIKDRHGHIQEVVMVVLSNIVPSHLIFLDFKPNDQQIEARCVCDNPLQKRVLVTFIVYIQPKTHCIATNCHPR